MITLSKLGRIYAITALLYDFDIVQLDVISDTLFRMRKGDYFSEFQRDYYKYDRSY